MTAYATGKHAKGVCDRCGGAVPYLELRSERGTRLMVCSDCEDEPVPAPRLRRPDAVALRNPRPDVDLLVNDPPDPCPLIGVPPSDPPPSEVDLGDADSETPIA